MNLDIVGDLESKAAALGLSIEELCAEAGVARTTFTRWKTKRGKQTTPNFSTYKKFVDALDRCAKRTSKRVKHNGANGVGHE